jgi:exodeoxyribonuclease VII small subunit
MRERDPKRKAEAAGAPADAPGEREAPSFEESARRLTRIVEELESGELTLERSLELFEEGMHLAKAAQDRLDRAERRVEELLGVDATGKALTRPFDGG